jgi:hypothetical protein
MKTGWSHSPSLLPPANAAVPTMKPTMNSMTMMNTRNPGEIDVDRIGGSSLYVM